MVLAGLEDPGGAEEHGHMRVVPARVHLPGVPALVLPIHGLLEQTKQGTGTRRQPAAQCRAKPGTAARRAIFSSEKRHLARSQAAAVAEHA